ncbi:MAG: YgiT-type zinc finger protein [Nitrososphaerales archaeon]
MRSGRQKANRCFSCGGVMEDATDTYYDIENGIIVLHEVLKCRNCGEIMLTSEQMKKFVTKLKKLGIWKKGTKIKAHAWTA